MPRPIWKGHISFGLVNVPVVLYSGEQREDVKFNLVDRRDRARIRYQRVNETTGEEVPWNEIVKAWEYEDDKYVLMSDEDFARVAPEASKTIDLESFVSCDEIPDMYFDKPYILEPGRRGEKGYALLRETLKQSGKCGIARVVIRSKQNLCMLKPTDGALAVIIMRFPHEVRDPEHFDLPGNDLKELKISKQEISMAEKLVDSMTAEWNPEEYKDDYHEKLLTYIDEKVSAGQLEEAAEAPEAEVEEEASNVVDMMALLKESVEKKKKGGSTRSPKKRSSKKSSKKKATA